MAKSKKVKEVIEEPKVELPVEPIIETPKEEVKEPEAESLVITQVVAEPEKEFPISVPMDVLKEAANQEHPPIKIIDNSELSSEQKILNFIESRDAGQIKLNDFLKSLYGVPKFNEPAKWLSQASSKELKLVLDKLSNEGQISIVSNAHMKLGTFYYPDTSTMKTEYHNLNTISIIAIKRN